jgi:hypothetical protein
MYFSDCSRQVERPLDNLYPVLDAARKRGRRPLQPKVNRSGYVPQDGIACVMRSTIDTMAVFGVPLVQRLSMDTVVNRCFFPVPADAQHVALMWMDYADVLVDPELDDGAVLQHLHHSQRRLDREFAPLAGRINFSVALHERRMWLDMYPDNVPLYDKCWRAEAWMQKAMGVRRKRQSQHLVLGYFRPGTRVTQRRVAEARIWTHVDYLLGQLSPDVSLSFEAPQICVYTAHNKFKPLFTADE